LPRWRTLLGSAGVVGAVMLLVSLAVWPTWPLEWARPSTLERMSAESNASVWTVDRLLPPSFAGPLVPLVAAFAVLVIFGLWYRAARPDTPTALAGAIAVALFVAPHVRHYDQTVLLVSIALIIWRLADLEPRVRVPMVTTLVAILIVVPWVLYGIAVSRGVTRAVPDLHEEWSALLPPVVLGLVIVVDAAARWRPRGVPISRAAR
jgi:hypothetical protein